MAQQNFKGGEVQTETGEMLKGPKPREQQQSSQPNAKQKSGQHKNEGQQQADRVTSARRTSPSARSHMQKVGRSRTRATGSRTRPISSPRSRAGLVDHDGYPRKKIRSLATWSSLVNLNVVG